MFKAAVKKDTFLDKYLAYMSPLETPLAYDFWCGIWLLSSLVGRRTCVARPVAPVFLNVYAVLCADAGTTRKSSAIRMCETVYRAAGLDKQHALISGKTTPEGIVKELSVRSNDGRGATASILVSELVTFLGKEQYAMGMPGLLTDLYDCPLHREGFRVGTDARTIKNVYVNFLTASTPSWLVRAINPDVIEGGFTSRCLFIIEEKRKQMVAWPTVTDPTDRLDNCVQSLHSISRKIQRYHDRGINLTDIAKTDFIKWYENRDYNATDPFTASFEAREDHHVLRLAGLLAINDQSFVIDAFHVRHAIRIIASHKLSAATLFGSGRADRRIVNGIDKLRDVLANAGALGLSQTELLFKLRNYMRTREIEYALIIMHELEMVAKFEVKTGGRPKTVWRGSNKLLSRHLNETLMTRLKED